MLKGRLGALKGSAHGERHKRVFECAMHIQVGNLNFGRREGRLRVLLVLPPFANTQAEG